ncbi:hypothetical protein [Halorientalis sp.]|uniref:hypothetical protein n=1 Tax=Halorientalis sp. TaxID=1931229 RepID=UPI002621724E|nr:hypothetical protein [Halorientalis sp.]
MSLLFTMLFATFFYLHGSRGPLVPFGLFAIAITALRHRFYRLGDDESRRGQIF